MSVEDFKAAAESPEHAPPKFLDDHEKLERHFWCACSVCPPSSLATGRPLRLVGPSTAQTCRAQSQTPRRLYVDLLYC
jgi:hypothetical protein